MSTPPADEKTVPAQEDGTGARDREAPIEGGQLHPATADDVDWGSLIKSLPKKERAKAVKRLQSADPKLRGVRRDRVRFWLTIILLIAIIGESVTALYLVEGSDTLSWDTAKDWLLLSLVPLTTAATIAVAFWFPTKESDS
jgi:hypothetical protein